MATTRSRFPKIRQDDEIFLRRRPIRPGKEHFAVGIGACVLGGYQDGVVLGCVQRPDRAVGKPHGGKKTSLLEHEVRFLKEFGLCHNLFSLSGQARLSRMRFRNDMHSAAARTRP